MKRHAACARTRDRKVHMLAETGDFLVKSVAFYIYTQTGLQATKAKSVRRVDSMRAPRLHAACRSPCWYRRQRAAEHAQPSKATIW